MIANAITAVIGFLANYLGKFLSTKALGAVIFALYYSIALAFWAYLVSVIMTFYNQVSDLINYASGSTGIGSNDVMCKMFGLLDCIGFIDGFNASKPMLFSSLITMFTMIAYKEVYRIKKDIVDKVFKYI